MESTITCPHCGHQKKEQMRADACEFFYKCDQCHRILKPDAGDCCVFCSYGTIPCPSVQKNNYREE